MQDTTHAMYLKRMLNVVLLLDEMLCNIKQMYKRGSLIRVANMELDATTNQTFTFSLSHKVLPQNN